MPETENIFEKIKAQVTLERVLQLYNFTLRVGRGERQCLEHDSLYVNETKGVYTWFSGGSDHDAGESGDIFTFVQSREHCDVKAAAEIICRKLNLTAPVWSGEHTHEHLAAREREDALEVAATVFTRWLLADEKAMEYVRYRGWTEETVNKARLGYSGDGFGGSAAQKKEMHDALLLAEVDFSSPVAVAIMGYKGDVAHWLSQHSIANDSTTTEKWIQQGYIPSMLGQERLIYPNVYRGRVVYMSARGVYEKKVEKENGEIDIQRGQYALPSKLVGSKPLYYNWKYTLDAQAVVIVEGQADAISLAQWGYAAVALSQLKLSQKDAADKLDFARIDKNQDREKKNTFHQVIYISLDRDKAGNSEYMALADLCGPMARLLDVTYGHSHQHYIDQEGMQRDAKDSNDVHKAMAQANVPPENQTALIYAAMNGAGTFVETRCILAGKARGAEKDDLINQALTTIVRMSDLELSKYRKNLADKIGVNITEFKQMLATMSATVKNDDEEGGEPIYTFGDVVVVRKLGSDEKEYWLIEVTYDKDSDSTKLALRDPSGKVWDAPSIVINGKKYKANPPTTAMRIGAVQFPSKLGEKKTIGELVSIVDTFLRSVYLWPSEKIPRLFAYYVMLTWMYNSFNTIIYLRVTGDAGAGKSEAMRRTGLLCYRMMTASGGATLSPLFRNIETYKCTVFIDEADMLNDPGAAGEMTKFYNSGAMKDNPIWRSTDTKNQSGGKAYESEAFQIFGPKLIAMRGEFKDDAVSSRCVTVKLESAGPRELFDADIPLEINNAMREQALAIRNMLLRWRMENWVPEIEIDKRFYNFNISSRLNQVAGPLLAIARDDETQRQDIQDTLEEYYKETIYEKSTTKEARVIEAMWKILLTPHYKNDKEFVRSDEDGTWIKIGFVADVTNDIITEMNKTREDDEEDATTRKMKSRTIGTILRKTLGFKGSERRSDGYWILFNESKLKDKSTKFGVDPTVMAPDPEEEKKPKPEQTKLV